MHGVKCNVRPAVAMTHTLLSIDWYMKNVSLVTKFFNFWKMLCKADRAQSNDPTLRCLANFYIELEKFLLFTYGSLSLYMSTTLFK